MSHSWSRACEPTRYPGSPFQAIRAEFARDQVTSNPSLHFRNLRSQHRPSSTTTRRAKDHARAIPLLNQYLLEPGGKKPGCPKKTAYLCLQQVRVGLRRVSRTGLSLARSPGHSMGSHGQRAVARIRQRAHAMEKKREVTTHRSGSNSFDEKNEVDDNAVIRGMESDRALARNSE